MPSFSGTFSGRVEPQGALTVGDEENHQMMLARVQGPQHSPDPSWNGSTIAYSALLDLVGGSGRRGWGRG